MDFIQCDIKLDRTQDHRKWTGIDNQRVFNNVGRASLLGIPMVVRTPLVPGVTDSPENLAGSRNSSPSWKTSFATSF